MASPSFTCDANELITDAKCFLEPCLGKEDRLAIELYLRVKNLAAIGGTDYSSDLNGLLTAAKAYQVFACNQREAIRLWISMQNAINDGALIDQDVNSLKAAAKCFECIPSETKKNVLLFLGCSINTEIKPE